MQKEIIIRQILLTDKQQLADLYDKVWPESSGSHYQKTSWAIDTSEYHGICAEVDGKIVGSRACFHTNMYMGKKKMKCVQFGDSCVDERYRGIGLFSRMNKEFLAYFFQSGGELIYNISVDASRIAYERVGWVYIQALSHLMYFPKPLSLLFKTKGQIKRLAGNMESDRNSIPNVDVISDELLFKREQILSKDDSLLHNFFDKEAIKWRLGTDSNIKLVYDEKIGACFYKTGNKNGLRCCEIGEMFLFEYTQRCFDNMHKKLMETERFDIMSVVISHAHPLYDFYKKNHYLYNPKKYV